MTLGEYHTLTPVPVAGGTLWVKPGVRGFPDPQYDLLAQCFEPHGPTALDLNPGAGVVTLALLSHGLQVVALETSRAAQRCLEASFGSKIDLRIAPPWQTQPHSSHTVALVLPAHRGTAYVEASLWGAANALELGGRLWIAGNKDKGFERYFRLAQDLLGYGMVVKKAGPVRVAVLEKEHSTPALGELWTSFNHRFEASSQQFLALPGVFSAQHLDPGSLLLLKHLPAQLGRTLELGGGYGGMALPLLERCTHYTLLEDDWVSLLSLQQNLLTHPLKPHLQAHFSDVDSALTNQACFTTVVSNPPFHVGGLVVLETAQAFTQAAHARLERGGKFYLVANRFLPYEPLLEPLFGNVETLAVESHKVLMAHKP